jgi:hypothetical protein
MSASNRRYFLAVLASPSLSACAPSPAHSCAGALADGVSQCADGGLAARATLQALALETAAAAATTLIRQ